MVARWLSGEYGAGEDKIQFFNTESGRCVVLAIRKLANGIGNMSKDRCEEALRQGLRDCPSFGGIGTDGNWDFRVDINAGICPS
ncbi:hypothetical protein NM208_g12893 [Fusarium decemcellulare]|uniref:Uncharacterized protein n=1 Tax=Fusarium decemcellulare TaxID=57161 RepID=A0ACC1RQF8_9HYPO|nr:hypothetical protein NM208_g12893 [Fusarium decemcellulare]